MSETGNLAASSEETRVPGFWELMGFAVILGMIGAFAALVFLGITGIGADWYGDPSLGWFEGEVWWVAVAAAAGLIVGLLHKLFAMPDKTPGLIADLQSEHIELKWVPSIVTVSAVSLIGGASLGPEVALGQMGGGSAGWIAKRRSMDDDNTKSLTLSGLAGAFGGLFSSPLVAMSLVLEIARPARKRFERAFYGSLVASSISFGIYFAIAGSVFLGIYDVPSYEYEDWHLIAGVGLGLFAVVVVFALIVVATAVSKLFSRMSIPAVAKPVVGGVIFGLIGVALPLTNFTGSGQLATVLENAGTLGVGLLIALLIGKMIAFAASTASGFIGGPIFPILFLGGVAGILVNAVFPDLPLGLTFTCMLAAVPGTVVSAPFSLVLLVALLTQLGAIHTAPVLIAVGTAHLTVAGLRYVASQRTSSQSADTGQQEAG